MARHAGDIQRAKVWTAKRAIRGATLRQRMLFLHRPIGREHGDPRTGTAHFPATGCDDVSFGVEAHPVDAPVRSKVVQDAVRPEPAIVEYRIGPKLSNGAGGVVALRDVECSLVK